MTREEQIKAEKIWQVSTNTNPDVVHFEGSRNKCLEFIRISFGKNAYRMGRARIARLIFKKP